MTTALSRPAAAPALRRKIWIDLLLYPGHTLPTAAAPVLVSIGLAIHDRVFAAGPLAFAFLASWLIHVGGVFADNLVLITRHADVPEHPELLDALATGELTVRRLTLVTMAWLAAPLLLAPYLATIVGWPAVVLLGALGIASALAYSAGPLPYTRVGLSDPVFFAMFALVAVPAAYVVQAAANTHLAALTLTSIWRLIPREAFVVGLPVGALVTNVLLIDEIRDVEFDRRKGWRTGAVRHGLWFSRAEIIALTLFAYAVPFWLWMELGFSATVLLPLATAPTAAIVATRVARSARFEDLFPMTPRASQLSLTYALLLGLGLAMG